MQFFASIERVEGKPDVVQCPDREAAMRLLVDAAKAGPFITGAVLTQPAGRKRRRIDGRVMDAGQLSGMPA